MGGLTMPSMPSRVSVAEAAADIIAANPPQAGHAMPYANWVTILRKAGWPVTLIDVDLPQREHKSDHGYGSNPRIGQQTGSASQPVATVPTSWLQELATRLNVPWAVACRGIVARADE